MCWILPRANKHKQRKQDMSPHTNHTRQRQTEHQRTPTDRNGPHNTTLRMERHIIGQHKQLVDSEQ